MDFILEEAIGAVIGDIAGTVRTTAGRERFAVMVERLLASSDPVERWLGSGVAMTIADQAQAQYECQVEGRVWNVYAIGRVGETGAFYIGASQMVAARYARHLRAARCPTSAAGQLPVAVRIRAELPPNGPGTWVETILPNLPKEIAKKLEATLVAGLVRGGVELANQELRGQHAPPNRYPPDSPEYDEAHRKTSRGYHREQYATPTGRIRHLACCALRDLKKGGSLTPTRQKHINAVGPDFIAKARIILAARGDTWPEPEVLPD